MGVNKCLGSSYIYKNKPIVMSANNDRRVYFIVVAEVGPASSKAQVESEQTVRPTGSTPERGTPESGTPERGTPQRGTPERVALQKEWHSRKGHSRKGYSRT